VRPTWSERENSIERLNNEWEKEKEEEEECMRRRENK